MGGKGAVFRSTVFEGDVRFEPGRLFFNHAATLVVLDSAMMLANGETLNESRILVAAFGGMMEGGADNIVWLSHSEDGGNSWSEPYRLTDSLEVDGDTLARDPLLFEKRGRIFLIYRIQPGPGSGARSPRIDGYLRTSDDGGLNWSDPSLIDIGERQDGGFRFYTPLSPPVVDNEGRLHFAFHYRERGDATTRFGHFSTSDFQQYDFHFFDDIYQPSPFRMLESALTSEAEELIAWFRSSGGQILQARSNDFGVSWSDFTGTNIPNPDSKSELLQLGDDLLIACNNSMRDRRTLSVALRRNGGFISGMVIDETAGVWDQFSYPSIRRDASGRIHCVYSDIRFTDGGRRRGAIRYAQFSEGQFRRFNFNLGDFNLSYDWDAQTYFYIFAGYHNSFAALNSDGSGIWTTNAGRHWASFRLMDGAQIFTGQKIHFWDDSNALIASSIGFFLTADSGRTWELDCRTNVSLRDAEYLSLTHYVGISSDKAFVKLGDDTLTVNFPQNSSLRALHFLDDLTGWICEFSGALYQTSDGGMSWHRRDQAGFPNLGNDIAFKDLRVGWVVTAGGEIYRTNNSGITWFPVYEAGSSSVAFTEVISRGTEVLALSEKVVLHSYDGYDFGEALSAGFDRSFAGLTATDDRQFVLEWLGEIFVRNPMKAEGEVADSPMTPMDR